MSDQPAPDLAEAPLPHLLAVAGHVVGQRWARITSQEHGLTSAGFRVLLALAHGDGVRPEIGEPGWATTHRDLARRCWIRPATLTGVVDTLERAGLVERVRDAEDRRQIWITLTPLGVERHKKLGSHLHHAFAPTAVERDPAKEAVIREYLTELITTHHTD
jgi:DNA-binding MarR family transcriptional regulator